MKFLSASQWIAVALCLGLAVTTAQASCSLTSVRMGQQLINVGDTERRAVQAEPDRTIQLETREGGAAGYRLDFYKPNHTLQIYIRHGKVSRICRAR